ncbi:large extracellular alpha-helical protein [Anaerolinea thermolimosa]|nr:Ig-like domain-containing alpha-2-macroglobulin family protein [Anaerolinea thermolimosa]GAP08080.1 large extracellular alpha-helical protein [Anaerolinea thermolimosa]
MTPSRRFPVVIRFYPVLAALVAVSLACSLFPLGRQAVESPPSGEPTPTPALAAGGKPLAQSSLPPVLVETDPPPGSEISPTSPLVFFFNQPMDRPSVEAALQGQPPLSGRFEWLDDSTVRFVSDQPFPAGASLQLTFAASARASNGQALQEQVELAYQVADSLRVAERIPAPGVSDANPAAAVVVTFNRPVVPLGEDPAAAPAAFTLQPEAPGRGEWLNTSTYIFYPEPALAGGVRYTVLLNQSLTSSDGVPLSLEGLQPEEWSFSTALPAVVGAKWGDRSKLELDGKVTVTFNQPMDRQSVEENLRLLDDAGRSTPLSWEWNEESNEVTLQPQVLLARGAHYMLVISAAARSLGGASIGVDTSFTIETTPPLAVESTSPAIGELLNANYGQAFYVINLTAPLADQDLKALVRVEPSISSLRVTPTYDHYGVAVEGAFQPSTTYTITLDAALRDRWGGTLGQVVQLQVTTETPPPSLVIPIMQVGASAIFVPAGQATLDVRVTNLSQAQLERGTLSVTDFIQQQSFGGVLRRSNVQRWSAGFEVPPNRSTPQKLPLDPAGQPPAPGLYHLKIAAPGMPPQTENSYLLVVSRVHLTLKVSQRQAVIWAVDLATRAPLEGLPLTFLNPNGERLAACVTAADGLCSAELPARDNPYEDVYAVSGNPGEALFAFVSRSMSVGLNAWELGIPTEVEADRNLVYLYSDRPIYRPGQTVHFKVVLQHKENARYTPLDQGEVEVKVLPPYDYTQPEQKPLVTLRLPVSALGTADGSFDLPADAQPGYYTLQTTSPEASLPVQVAEYRKPAFDLQVAFEKPEYQAGEALAVNVRAQYYFGAPVNDLSVNWQLYARPDWVFLPENMQSGAMDDSWLYPPDFFAPGMGQFVAQGQGQTGADGTLQILIPAEAYAQLSLTNRRQLVIELTAQDESNQMISARAEATLHPSSFYIGVRPEAWSVQAGEEIGFAIQTFDWANQPAGAHTLRAVFSRVEWDIEGESAFGYPSYRKVLTEVGSSDLRTDALGRARVAFTPPEVGTYQLEVSGEGALTQVLVWVSGPGMAPWPTLPNQRLRLEADATEYRPGQTARIRIPNPFGAGALALVSVERSRVMRTYVVEVNEALYEFRLPLESIDAPNIYVSVILMGRTQDGKPDFRQGYLGVTVNPDELRLKLEASFTPPQAGPGDTVRLNLRATDSEGRPVQGEFSLALVDKAVLALSDPNSLPIFEAFYGNQPLGVQTSLNLTVYSGRLQAAAAPGRGGGGGGEAAVSPGVRTRFEDTALWVPTLETNEDGLASVEIRLPDNLTTWVADIRGLNASMQIGEARVELIVTRDLLVRPVTPRFLVVGDHVQLGAVVQNNTGAPLRVEVSMEAPGLTLDEGVETVQKVDVPPNSRKRVDWWATVQDVPSVDPIFRAASGDLEDVTHTELGALPVLRYTATQTYATAGLLAEGGKRLEVVSLPRSFTPLGGELRLELTPSLASTVLQGLKAMDAFPTDFTEPVISRLMANAAAYRALKGFNLQAPDLQSSLERAIRQDLGHLLQWQRPDGGWSWGGVTDQKSDRRLTAYALIALHQVSQGGFFVTADAINRAQQFLKATLVSVRPEVSGGVLDDEVLVTFALQQSGMTDLNLDALYDLRERLTPWNKAMLAMSLEGIQPGDERARTLLSDLAGLAQRSATGAHWQTGEVSWRSWATPIYTTAVVVYALASVDPASPLLTDAVRYLVLHRRPSGCWSSSYDSAWSLLGLSQALQSTGDLQASYSYQADLNGGLFASGNVDGPQGALKGVTVTAPLSQLLADAPNALEISRTAGNGRLYYRVYLQVSRAAAEAPAYSRGIFLQREYFRGGVDCRAQVCAPVQEAEVGNPDGLVVRLTLTLPEDLYYVVVEDFIPAGAEIINPNLKTSRQGFATPDLPQPENDLLAPFRSGWGWWYFGQAQVYDDRVRWVAPYLPAGSYTLVYRLSPALAGDFQVIPAHAYQYYFPEVEGRSKGDLLIFR